MRLGFVIAALTGCGRLGFDGGDGSTGDALLGDGGPITDDDATTIDAAPSCTFGAWGPPIHLTSVNGAANDWSPTLSDDGLELIFESSRDGGENLYHSVRASTADPFPAPVALTALNSPQDETAPTLSADRLTIYFSSNRSSIAQQLFRATRSTPADPFGAPQLVLELSTTEILGPALSAAGTELFWNDASDSRIERATLISGAWVASGTVTELGTQSSRYPDLSRDGLTIYFELNGQIMSATRAAQGAAFEGTTAIDPVNTGSVESDPELGDRDRALVFASERGGGLGQSDLWMSTRPCD